MINTKSCETKKAEIVQACRELYQKMSFKDITMKEISSYTRFSRPSIYNYFQTKESIFLEIFRQEYIFWCDEMENIIKKHQKLSTEEFASTLSQTLDRRPVLLKLLSMNIYDLEENCSVEDLTAFKKEYKRALEMVDLLLQTYFPCFDIKKREQFIYTFFPFMFGLYPYANVTEKQKEAMNKAGMIYPVKSVYDFTYQTILSLLQCL